MSAVSVRAALLWNALGLIGLVNLCAVHAGLEEESLSMLEAPCACTGTSQVRSRQVLHLTCFLASGTVSSQLLLCCCAVGASCMHTALGGREGQRSL